MFQVVIVIATKGIRPGPPANVIDIQHEDVLTP